VDAIIAQGTEAGGHTGVAGTLALVPAVIDAVGDIPVLAAGGIADGRGLAAVLMLGAVGASLGTRFVASEEWGGGAWEQQAVLAASADDTLRTSVYDQVREAPFPAGIADRVLRNGFNSAWDGRMTEITAQRAELQRVLEAGSQAQDPAVVDISAGVAVGLIHSLEPAGAIVQRIIAEAEALLRQRAAALVVN
jgi:nitronate monooxygenase